MDNSNNKNYAGFWKRFLAYWVDTLIVVLITIPLNSLSAFNQVAIPSDFVIRIWVNPMGGIIGLAVTIAYFIFFWVHEGGQTLGHRLLALRVVREDGKPIDIGTGIIRYIGYVISNVVLCLGFLWVVFDSKKQGWHDKMARTVVVKTDGKSHTGIAIALFIIPLIIILTIMGLAILLAANIAHQSKLASDNAAREKRIALENAIEFPKAVFAAANQYRTSRNLSPMIENATLCSYAIKRIGELEINKGFDNHIGMKEDWADPKMQAVYFAGLGILNEHYDLTGQASEAPEFVSKWSSSQNTNLVDPNWTIGCAQSDTVYTVFILAASEQKPALYNYSNPTSVPYVAPTMTDQQKQFEKDYNSAKATIQQSFKDNPPL